MKDTSRRDFITKATRSALLAGVFPINPAMLKFASEMARAVEATKDRVSRDRVRFDRTRVFAAGPKGGSPCLVAPFTEGLTSGDMQALAKKFTYEIVFLVKPKSAGTDIGIRYFVPDHELGISGHATIAGVTVALKHGLLSGHQAKIDTISGIFSAQWETQDDEAIVTVDQLPPAFAGVCKPEEIAPSLKANVGDFDLTSPIQSVSVSRPMLLIPLKDARVLDKLTPDFEALWRFCEKSSVAGFYPFSRKTQRPNASVEARLFPDRSGFPEDPATGIAAAALAAYLARYDQHNSDGIHAIRVAQGFAMGAPSLIEAFAFCSGNAITKTAIRGSATSDGSQEVALDG